MLNNPKTDFVASVLIQNKRGLFLVFEGRDEILALPGGSGERNEKPAETAIREAFEETSLRVQIEKLVALHQLIVFNSNGTKRREFLHYLFLASTEDDNPRPGAEWRDSVVKCRWIKLRDLKTYRKVWPLPEEVRSKISDGILNLGNLGELEYHMI